MPQRRLALASKTPFEMLGVSTTSRRVERQQARPQLSVDFVKLDATTIGPSGQTVIPVWPSVAPDDKPVALIHSTSARKRKT